MKPIPITFFTTLKGNTMNQSELINKTAQVTGLPKTAVEDALKTAGDLIAAALIEEGEAVLPGLGKLVAVQKAERPGRNPKTGEAMTIPARKSVKFKAGKVLTEALAA